MGFMNKVKNFFYEDVEEEVDDYKPEEPKKKFNPFKKEPKVEEIEKPEEVVKDVKQEANNDLSERELFRAERTFNFPMDLGDEIFDEEEKVKETTEVMPTISEPVKEETYTRSIYRNISREEPKKEEKKKFRPSPVISPVYGILDKNYTVDDVVEADKTKEFSFDKKIVDFDSVRNRAYKDLDEELEKTMNNDIFFNLDEEQKEEENTAEEEINNEEPSVIITYDEVEEETPIEAEEVEFKEAEVKEIVPEESEEDTEEEKEEDDLAPDVKIETPKRSRRNRIDKEEKEKEDLFNLIDNMYNEDEEEEE